MINCHGLKMHAEASSTELTKIENPQGLNENKIVAKSGGSIAEKARREIEDKTGQPVVSSKNATELNKVVAGMRKEVTEEKIEICRGKNEEDSIRRML